MISFSSLLDNINNFFFALFVLSMDYICIPLIETKGVMDLSKLTNGHMDIHLYIHEHRGATHLIFEPRPCIISSFLI